VKAVSLQEFLPTPAFDEYRERFKDFFILDRRDDGVLLAQAHTRGDSIKLSVQNHRALGQFLKTVGADPENEVLILTGSGRDWMMGSDPQGFEIEENDLEYWAYEYAYKDGRANVSSQINDLQIPTIGLVNGDGYHSEVLLMCDLTLMSEDAHIYDLHYGIGSIPGDGVHSCFQELLGVKRAAYALLTGESIDARAALDYGMVNEILPQEHLVTRAYAIADHIMKQPRTIRRLTTQIIRRPWKKRIVDDLDGGFGIQMFGHLTKRTAAHSDDHIINASRYVREGRRIPFD
jgi:enoyl-CoA hydratase/carnithine racemase